MNIYGRQLQERSQYDNRVFRDTLTDAAYTISDSDAPEDDQWGSLVAATGIVLDYFGKMETEMPETIRGIADVLDYRMRRHGIMYRRGALRRGWRKNAVFPMIGFKEDDHEAVALIPNSAGKYKTHYYKGGYRTAVAEIPDSALCEEVFIFYRPLPMRPLELSDLVTFFLKDISVVDMLKLVLATILVPLIVSRMAMIYESLFIFERIGIFPVSGLVASALALFFINVYILVMGYRVGDKMICSLKCAVMGRILNMRSSFFKDRSSGSIATLVFETDTLCKSLFSGIITTALGVVSCIYYVINLENIAKVMTFFLTWLIVLNLVYFIIMTIAKTKVASPLAERSAAEYAFSYELLNGINKIKLRGATKRFFAKWGRKYLRVAKLKFHPPLLVRIGTLPMVALNLIFTFYLYLVVDYSDMSVANYQAYTVILSYLMVFLLSLPKAAGDLANVRALIRLMEPLMSAEPEVGEGEKYFVRIRGSVSLRKVSFSYGEKEPEVIRNLSLHIRPGEYVALTGSSGCGKSTLLRLILGYEIPVSGNVLFDDIDSSVLDMQYIRRQIGCVLQNGKLFDGDIFSNISICAQEMTMEEAWELAEMAGIAEDIRKMPMGMRTLINGSGDNISGGQRQRILIARAIAAKPKILIMDEATSALDNATQARVTAALDKLGCTRIIIAHRLSTVRNCDRIIVLDDGNIAEEGTYDELIAKGGLFEELVRLQRI